MTHDDEARRRSIERDVLAYVLERPAAKDTAEGVRHWWLRAGSAATARDVRLVLAELSAKQWLAVRGMQGEAGEDALVYELNAGRTDEIRKHLAAARTDGPAARPAPAPGPAELPGRTELG